MIKKALPGSEPIGESVFVMLVMVLINVVDGVADGVSVFILMSMC